MAAHQSSCCPSRILQIGCGATRGPKGLAWLLHSFRFHGNGRASSAEQAAPWQAMESAHDEGSEALTLPFRFRAKRCESGEVMVSGGVGL